MILPVAVWGISSIMATSSGSIHFGNWTGESANN